MGGGNKQTGAVVVGFMLVFLAMTTVEVEGIACCQGHIISCCISENQISQQPPKHGTAMTNAAGVGQQKQLYSEPVSPKTLAAGVGKQKYLYSEPVSPLTTTATVVGEKKVFGRKAYLVIPSNAGRH
ncbi:hypothetical protein L1987_60784 [Smallanthus sonchifolius]|uniref:Uncharacterized protein n=1 Tax=Smallanthus sonchifolius TaxID=185202 RepID=A0ACB9D9X3_9ASTR|nr:hypothetical protein L1987_60784 [Smallanthus sonchifolius]